MNRPVEPACELIFAYSHDVLDPAVTAEQFHDKWTDIIKATADPEGTAEAFGKLDRVLLRAVKMLPKDQLHLLPDALRKQCYMEFGV